MSLDPNGNPDFVTEFEDELSRAPAVPRLAWTRRTPGRGLGYRGLLWAGSVVFAAVLLAIIATLLYRSGDAWSTFGIGFVWGKSWDTVRSVFGALPFIVGTLVTSAIALVVAVPVGIACAAYLTEMAPRWLRPFGVLVDLIAAVPSVIVGLWGLLVAAPVFSRDVEPFFKKVPGVSWFFHGTPFGVSVFLAGFILSIMVVPTIVALTRTALLGVGVAEREGGMALGATPWQVVRKIVLPGARSGIVAAVVLALGRAVGETIAVTLVIGNSYSIPHSLLAPGATLGSVIVNQFGDSSTIRHEQPALIALGVILLVIGLLINGGGQVLLRSRFKQAQAK
ncbi:MAG TPA: phosphate ABC transporter permease subunit PstC [Acidimicrobiales bacterium]|nr:phosphate ABC transporter permease subunit PstC [Acidimicrobiales bacterium]